MKKIILLACIILLCYSTKSFAQFSYEGRNLNTMDINSFKATFSNSGTFKTIISIDIDFEEDVKFRKVKAIDPKTGKQEQLKYIFFDSMKEAIGFMELNGWRIKKAIVPYAKKGQQVSNDGLGAVVSPDGAGVTMDLNDDTYINISSQSVGLKLTETLGLNLKTGKVEVDLWEIGNGSEKTVEQKIIYIFERKES